MRNSRPGQGRWPGAERRDAAAHVRAHRASRPRRGRRAPAGGRCSGHPAPARDRSRPRRPADLQRGPLDRGRAQRRDLQLPRAARGPGSSRAHVSHCRRHRGDRPPLRAAGRGLRPGAEGHVRGGGLGLSRAPPCARARPSRQEAAVLCRARRRALLRLRASGAARGSRARAHRGLRRAGRLPRPAIRAQSADGVRRDRQARAGAHTRL